MYFLFQCQIDCERIQLQRKRESWKDDTVTKEREMIKGRYSENQRGETFLTLLMLIHHDSSYARDETIMQTGRQTRGKRGGL